MKRINIFFLLILSLCASAQLCAMASRQGQVGDKRSGGEQRSERPLKKQRSTGENEEPDTTTKYEFCLQRGISGGVSEGEPFPGRACEHDFLTMDGLGGSTQEDNYCFTAKIKDKKVGGITFFCSNDDQFFYVPMMYVNPEYRGKGIGGLLLQKLLGFAISYRNAQGIELAAGPFESEEKEYSDDLHRLVKWYTKHGFSYDPNQYDPKDSYESDYLVYMRLNISNV